MATRPDQSIPYVFLSYASADRERALRIADLLEVHGISVWIDRKSIAGGTSWGAEIVEGIQGCRVLALLCSTAAVQSRNVQQEVQLAWEANRPILPLLLDRVETPSVIRYALAGRQWVEVLDRADDAWLPEALRALSTMGISLAAPTRSPSEPAVGGSASTGLLAASVTRSPRHNLPAQLTSFVGREREVAEIKNRLAAGVPSGPRLLTLTGTGGCGKTRLALEVGGALLGDYPDGVWLIELAPIGDPDLVASTVGTVLGLQDPAIRSTLAHLVEVLRSRRLLLILDNCEHLIDACAHLADALLRGCPQVQILATSREALGIGGEVSWRVPSLGVPPTEKLPAVPDLQQFEAVLLFVERARAVQPSFVLTSQNALAVAQICRRLDGIPLALELAAARLKGLSAEQLASRLDQRFRLLTGGSRAALPRQQTLAAAVAWSYDLLTPTEQALFNRLAVFVDGFTLEATETVGGDAGVEDVLDLLLRLVEKSLVVAEPGDNGMDRYRLLETLRQYGRDKLVASGEVEVISRRHAGFYLALAEEAEPALHGSEQVAWLDRLEGEHNNLRAAIEWYEANDGWVEALRLAGAISWFWAVRGYYTEGRARLSMILEKAGTAAPPILRAQAYSGQTYLAARQGDSAEARRSARAGLAAAREAGDKRWIVDALVRSAWNGDALQERAERFEEALALAREAALPWEVGRVLYMLAWGKCLDGDLAGAESAIAEGMAISRPTGDKWAMMWAGRVQMEIALRRGDYAWARVAAAENGRLAERLRDRSGRANALVIGGDAALAEGDLEVARSLLSDARTIYQEVADWSGMSYVAARLSALSLERGNVEEARALADESLSRSPEPGWYRQVALRAGADVAFARAELPAAAAYLREGFDLLRGGDQDQLPMFLESLAHVAVAQDQPARAFCLASAAATQRARLGVKIWPDVQPGLDAALRQAEQALSAESRAAAQAAGAAMSPEEAIEFALEEQVTPASS